MLDGGGELHQAFATSVAMFESMYFVINILASKLKMSTN